MIKVSVANHHHDPVHVNRCWKPCLSIISISRLDWVCSSDVLWQSRIFSRVGQPLIPFPVTFRAIFWSCHIVQTKKLTSSLHFLFVCIARPIPCEYFHMNFYSSMILLGLLHIIISRPYFLFSLLLLRMLHKILFCKNTFRSC